MSSIAQLIQSADKDEAEDRHHDQDHGHKHIQIGILIHFFFLYSVSHPYFRKPRAMHGIPCRNITDIIHLFVFLHNSITLLLEKQLFQS